MIWKSVSDRWRDHEQLRDSNFGIKFHRMSEENQGEVAAKSTNGNADKLVYTLPTMDTYISSREQNLYGFVLH